MKKLVFLSILFFGCGQIQTPKNEKPLGVMETTAKIEPSIAPNVITIHHTYYTSYFDTLLFSEIMGKYVQTVQHSLITTNTDEIIKRKGVATFTHDPLIPKRFEIATNAFYLKYNTLNQNTKVDKGHVNPYSAFDFDITAARESMFLENTNPQYSFFNEHQWEAAEQHVIKEVSLTYDKSNKKYLPNHDSVTVYTGVLISKNKISDGNNNFLYIPDFYWKVISYKNGGKMVYEAWLGKNSPDNKDTNPDDIKIDVVKLHSTILSYYPKLKLDF
jgi:DNA/RNA endonuclease G (NUC1)